MGDFRFIEIYAGGLTEKIGLHGASTRSTGRPTDLLGSQPKSAPKVGALFVLSLALLKSSSGDWTKSTRHLQDAPLLPAYTIYSGQSVA
jgi:hypothetical protein